MDDAVDIEMERRISTLIEKVNSSYDEGDSIKQKEAYSNDMLDEYLTEEKVEHTVEAVKNAAKLLEDGGTLEEAMKICDIDMLEKVALMKKKLELYLAPFKDIHSSPFDRYDRRFTKTEKLREIVDRLHNYVLDGDMIVDFCFGSNEFSCLMKEKLDTEGKKKCSFKNYDLFPTKNEFNFEQKSWYDVETRDLPLGSQLVMGLSPPSGYEASEVNKFINKALQFMPKLLILIVPPETQRLDHRNNKHPRYELLWEDQYLLAGESFYIPGAFSKDEQISQWNTPPLYLWSHPDYTQKHREIANRCGHSFSRDKLPKRRPLSPKHLPKEQQDAHGVMNSYLVDDIPGPMNAENMVTSNAYGMSNIYRPPVSNVYAPPMSNVYSPPMSNIFSPSESNVYAPPMSNAYSHSGTVLDNYCNTPNVEDKYIDVASVPGLTGMGGQTRRNLSGRENVTYLRSDSPLEDMEISPTNTNPRRSY